MNVRVVSLDRLRIFANHYWYVTDYLPIFLGSLFLLHHWSIIQSSKVHLPYVFYEGILCWLPCFCTCSLL